MVHKTEDVSNAILKESSQQDQRRAFEAFANGSSPTDLMQAAILVVEDQRA
jgi:hypothetical protein